MIEPYYQDDLITLYHGDSWELIPLLRDSVTALVTDPPYGIGESSKRAATRGKTSKLAGAQSAQNRSRTPVVLPVTDFGHFDWDKPLTPEQIAVLHTIGDIQIIWGGNHLGMPPSSCWLVWDKENGASDFADCELAYTNLKKAVRMFKYKWNGLLQAEPANKEIRLHPTQKPLALMKWCLSFLPEGSVILDPFAGAGSTLLAAKALGFKAIGIEREESYCKKATDCLKHLGNRYVNHRVSDEQLRLFT